jgi:peptidoglycan/LPS O-acetylase OafA/YrhL
VRNYGSPPQQIDDPETAGLKSLTADMPTQLQKASTYSQPKRIESLDTIRGLAALAVLLGHTLGTFAWPDSMVFWARFPLANMLFDGRSAVTMFFVLSGFVLSRPFLTKSPAEQNYRQLFVSAFYLRRVTRIWIPWFSIFCLSALMRAYCFHYYQTAPPLSEQSKHFWSADLTLSSFFRQCAFMLQNAERQLLPQDWSIRVELKGSALVPVFIFLARRHILLLFGAGGLLLLFIHTGSYYFSFVLGVFAAKCLTSGEPILRSLSFVSKCGLLVFGISLYQARLATNYIGMGGSGMADRIAWCICSIGCVIIITTSLGSRRIQATLSHGVLVFLGRVSYSVFLLQVIVIMCVLPPVTRGFNLMGVQSLFLLLPLTFVVAVSVTVAIAAITYRLIEVPSMALGHWASSYVGRQSFHRSTSPEKRQEPSCPMDTGGTAVSQNDQSTQTAK